MDCDFMVKQFIVLLNLYSAKMAIPKPQPLYNFVWIMKFSLRDCCKYRFGTLDNPVVVELEYTFICYFCTVCICLSVAAELVSYFDLNLNFLGITILFNFF